MKSKLLNLDLIIKKPGLGPYDLPRFDKVAIQINHNAAIKNKLALFPAISASMNLTNQYPQIRTASASYASFSIRKGMQFSLLTTLRHTNLLRNFYYKFMFFVYPQYFIAVDTSVLTNVFITPSSDSNFHIGIKISPSVTANIALILHVPNKEHSELKRFYFSYWNLPV